MSYAVIIQGKIACRALPNRTVAQRIAAAMGGKAICDPRCVQR
jgi:hypothetical protein